MSRRGEGGRWWRRGDGAGGGARLALAKRPGGSRASCSCLSAISCCRSLSRCWRAVASRACAPWVGCAVRCMG